MSKVQAKDIDLLNNLTDAGIAKELDSRLRDLEKNIAVAREFIKLADESYSEIRHKWNLLQEEAHGRPDASAIEKTAIPITKRPSRSARKEPAQRGEETGTISEELEIKDFEEFTKSSPSSRHRNKSGKPLKLPTDSEEALNSPDQLKNPKQSRNQERKTAKASRKN